MPEYHATVFAALALMSAVAFAAPEPANDQARVDWPAELPKTRPFLACTADELARLRETLKQGGDAASPIVALIKSAEENLKKPLEFPPRGGQHNQWYQCDKCQLALQTVDATHHQCPKCRTVYSGEPYDDVLFSKTHYANLRRALDASWAYAVTGRAEFAADSRAVLLGYAERYSKYPYHDNQRKAGPTGGHLNEQTLGEANMLATYIAPAVDLLHDEAALSPDDRKRINDGLLRPMMKNIAKHEAGKSNWQSWHNAALFAAGALLGDQQAMRFTIESPSQGFLNQMRVSVSGEGMWYENSWSYHAYTLQSLTLHAEFARRCGVDLWKQTPLRKMFTLPMRYEMPDGSLPRFGDAVGASKGVAQNDLECAYHAFKDPVLLPALSTSPTLLSALYGRDTSARAKAAPLSSEVFPGAGHAILRSQSGAGLAAAITFGPYGGFHGHFDKLSFVLFGHGRELGVDPGRAASQAYRLPIHTHWYKGSISHNVVLVNGKSQGPAEGRLRSFGANDDRAIAVAECDKAYDGVKHRRMLYVGPAYALVVDDVSASKASTFEWIYHNRGKSAEVSRGKTDIQPTDGNAKFAALKGKPGQEYVNWTIEGSTNEPIRAVFQDGDFATVLTAAGGAETLVCAGDGVGASLEERVPLVLLRRSGQRAVFAVAIEPTKNGSGPGVASAVEVDSKDGAIKVKVVVGKATEEFTIEADGSCQLKWSNGTLTAPARK